MDLFRLRKEFGAVVFGEEEMVDCGSHLYAEPFGELFVLNREILELILFANLSEELGKAIYDSRTVSISLTVNKKGGIKLTGFNDFSPEALHINIKLPSTLSCDLIKPLLLLDADLVHRSSSFFVDLLLLIQLYRLVKQKFIHRPTLSDLRVSKQCPEKGSE